MLTIQLITPQTTVVMAQIPDLPDEVIIYWQCGYCPAIVRAPKKFCCDNHRIYYCKKGIGDHVA